MDVATSPTRLVFQAATDREQSALYRLYDLIPEGSDVPVAWWIRTVEEYDLDVQRSENARFDPREGIDQPGARALVVADHAGSFGVPEAGRNRV